MSTWKELPRPATPGPWHAEEGEYECGSYCSINGCGGHGNGNFSIYPPQAEGGDGQEFSPRDARAIAALPDYVAEVDRLRARVEELEAGLLSIRREPSCSPAVWDLARALERP